MLAPRGPPVVPSRPGSDVTAFLTARAAQQRPPPPEALRSGPGPFTPTGPAPPSREGSPRLRFPRPHPETASEELEITEQPLRARELEGYGSCIFCPERPDMGP
ncbi:Structural maintenance of chromosomes protein 4 [Manis javanica]|nr:Structural maintenance of chromosomes protein 4 [Manis javanica]